ncbi:Asp23/Gls24 family envelope stress response protein [Streptomyces bauhiniae]
MTTPERRGTTTVSDRAVRRIDGRAVTEALPGRPARATGSFAAVRGSRAEAAVDVALPYPAPLTPTVRRVQDQATARTSESTRRDVRPARVGVTAPMPDRTTEPDTTAREAASLGRVPRRWWAQRRLPLGVLTLLATLTCGALATDLVLVHTGHRPAALWRTGALHWLYVHGPGEPPVTAAALGCLLLGVWLIVLAVTPGRRGPLTAHSPAPAARVAVDRGTVAALLRDTAAGITVRRHFGPQPDTTPDAVLPGVTRLLGRAEPAASPCPLHGRMRLSARSHQVSHVR